MIEMASTSPPSSPTVDQTISTVHPDIIQTHILTRLDGPTLAAAACVSSQLHALSTEEKLWQLICSSTWPSINDPRVRQVISTFPSGHRSFFSDSFPVLDHQKPQQLSSKQSIQSPVTTDALISAVDIYYQDKLIFSKVEESETVTGWFMCSPFRVDLLDPKESVSVLTPISHVTDNDTWLKNLEENMTLSWLLIDPTRKRAVDLSSKRPVSVERHWLTGEVQVRYATIVVGDGRRGSAEEFVECGVAVTCGENEGGEGMHVSEVCLQVEDMEGRSLNGRDSLVILEGALECGKRRKRKGNGNEGKERFEEFVEMKRERKERRLKRDRVLDMVCISLGVTIFVTFWSVILFS